MSEGRDLSLNRGQVIGLLTELGQEMFPADPAEPRRHERFLTSSR